MMVRNGAQEDSVCLNPVDYTEGKSLNHALKESARQWRARLGMLAEIV